VPGADIYQTETRKARADRRPRRDRHLDHPAVRGRQGMGHHPRLPERPPVRHPRAFIDSIDWGWFFFLTKPIFAVLHWLNAVIGNMGWAIIALTFILKALVLPLAYKSYVSMARMKELQPEMEALKERVGDDKQKMQKEMMQLYKDKKVNPAAGCLPILIQIPIFFSALQGDLRHHRTAPRAVLRLAHRPVDARPVVDLQPLRPPALGCAGAGQPAGADLHRDPADPAGHQHVVAAKAEPRPDRSGAGSRSLPGCPGCSCSCWAASPRAWWSTGSRTTSSPSCSNT
jgi:hypothetical protein